MLGPVKEPPVVPTPSGGSFIYFHLYDNVDFMRNMNSIEVARALPYCISDILPGYKEEFEAQLIKHSISTMKIRADIGSAAFRASQEALGIMYGASDLTSEREISPPVTKSGDVFAEHITERKLLLEDRGILYISKHTFRTGKPKYEFDAGIVSIEDEDFVDDSSEHLAYLLPPESDIDWQDPRAYAWTLAGTAIISLLAKREVGFVSGLRQS